MRFHSAAFTDIGKTRTENQDRFLCDEALGLFGVADGIGGLPGGAQAAACTVDFIQDRIRRSPGPAELVALAQDASAAVRVLGSQINPPHGIGTTLTYGVLHSGLLRLAHVGDSRCYVLRQGDFLLLTEDHNIANEARRLRARGEYVEITSDNRNALTRCIGQPGVPEVDFQEVAVSAGDRLFFTTDGITRMLSDAELADILSGPESPAGMLEIIRDLALRRGGHDNLTAVLVFIDEAR